MKQFLSMLISSAFISSTTAKTGLCFLCSKLSIKVCRMSFGLP